MMAIIMVGLWIVRRANIFHFVDAAAFRASLDRAVPGCLGYLLAVFGREAVSIRDHERMAIEGEYVLMVEGLGRERDGV